jgi:hypothetical protein
MGFQDRMRSIPAAFVLGIVKLSRSCLRTDASSLSIRTNLEIFLAFTWCRPVGELGATK